MPSAFFLTDSKRIPDPTFILRTLPRGSGVIFRDYLIRDRARKAHHYRSICRQYGLIFLVADDFRLAMAVGADGVHLPDRPPWQNFSRKPRHFLITAAAHNIKSVYRAEKLGADLVFISPVFPTESHPGVQVLKIHRFSRLAAWSSIPVYALGGIDPFTARQLPQCTAGIGAIAAFRN